MGDVRGGNIVFSLVIGLMLWTMDRAHAEHCPPEDGVALQVLGSGGPIADDGRASSGYLVWHDGRARALVDVGGGAFLRFAEAGARFSDLDGIFLTHLHADHSADLPALLKSGYFARRQRELVLAGPSGGGNARVSFPPITDYVQALLDPQRGAYGYLSGYLDGSDGMPLLRVTMLDSELQTDGTGIGKPASIQTVPLGDSALAVSAVAMPHGPVPAVAYRIEIAQKSVVIAGDQNGSRGDIASFAANADLLVLNMPVPESASRAALALHAPPSRLGEQAAEAQAKALLLSHFMARSLVSLDDNIRHVKRRYAGPVTAAQDLLCLPL